jgi:DNA-binding Xre family transcriptional regulator
MIDKKINRVKLCELADIGYSTITKLAKDMNVEVAVLEKICCVLDCDFVDIMEYIKDEPTKGQE